VKATSVTSGQTVSDVLVGAGDNLIVLAGGTADATAVSSGGTLTVSGGVASGTVLYNGLQQIFGGGSAHATVISSGSADFVNAGGIDTGAQILSGGFQSIDGGIADGAVVGLGAQQIVASGSAVDTIVLSGGEQAIGAFTSGSVISDGGLQEIVRSTAFATVISSGGLSIVESAGGSAASATIGAGGIELVLSGGSDSSAMVQSGGLLVVVSGGAATDTIRLAGGTVVIGAGIVLDSPSGVSVQASQADGDQVGAGDTLLVLTGAVASATVIGSGGLEYVLSGTDAGATVSGGGQILANALATGALVAAGGFQFLGLRASAVDTTVDSGGVVRDYEGTASGAVIGSGGELVVSGGSAVATTISGGTLLVGEDYSVDSGVTFAAGTQGLLVLSSGAAAYDAISGFAAGDSIDLAGLLYRGTTTATFSGGVLSAREGGVTSTVTLDPTGLDGHVFHLAGDTQGGTLITVTCFLAGTGIATLFGETLVEDLQPGDIVVLADGGVAAVRWLGVQTISRRFADPARVLPVRIAAGALGEGLPARDLLVSPAHALLLDGVLVQAGALVGLPGIGRAHEMAETFRYYHVELDAHALLLAEGVAAESYLETVETVAFDNRAGRPARALPAEMEYPRVKSVRQLAAALRARLAGRVAA
jgi:autotransporter passenger strand-loop-strand repeat protein